MNKKWLIAMIVAVLVAFGVGLLIPVDCKTCEQRESEAVQESAVAEEVLPEIIYQIPEGYIASDAVQIRVYDGEVQWYDGSVWQAVGNMGEMAEQDVYNASKESLMTLVAEVRQKRMEEQAGTMEDSMAQKIQMAKVPTVPKPEPTPTPTPESTPTPTPEPTPTPTPEPTPTPTPEPTPDTGDGEDIGWSDDYL